MPRLPPSVPLDPLGFPGYHATRGGRVLTMRAGEEPRPLKPGRHNKSGRLMVGLRDHDGKQRHMALARLILTAFGRPSPAGRGWEPAHRNGDTDDCRLENLKWVPKKIPDRGRAIKLIRGLMRRYEITVAELGEPNG